MAEDKKSDSSDQSMVDSHSCQDSHPCQQEEDPEYDTTEAPPITSSQQDSKPSILPNRKLDNFIWTTAPQSHALRRRCILEKYPEIEQLYGYDRRYVTKKVIPYRTYESTFLMKID